MIPTRRTVENQRLKLGIKIVGGSSALVIFSMGLAMFLVFHHHNGKPTPPKLPIFQLMSFYATPLSNTSSATWNLTVSLANPNRKNLFLSIQTLTFTNFYYPNNYSNNPNSSRVWVGDAAQLGPLLVQSGKQLILPPLIFSFSTQSVGAADQIIRDQASGRVEAGLTGSFKFQFGKAKKARFMGLSCIPLYIGYPVHGNGFVSNLPRNIEISDFDFDD